MSGENTCDYLSHHYWLRFGTGFGCTLAPDPSRPAAEQYRAFYEREEKEAYAQVLPLVTSITHLVHQADLPLKAMTDYHAQIAREHYPFWIRLPSRAFWSHHDPDQREAEYRQLQDWLLRARGHAASWRLYLLLEDGANIELQFVVDNADEGIIKRLEDLVNSIGDRVSARDKTQDIDHVHERHAGTLIKGQHSWIETRFARIGIRWMGGRWEGRLRDHLLLDAATLLPLYASHIDHLLTRAALFEQLPIIPWQADGRQAIELHLQSRALSLLIQLRPSGCIEPVILQERADDLIHHALSHVWPASYMGPHARIQLVLPLPSGWQAIVLSALNPQAAI